MEEALITRLRASAGVAAAAGTVNSRPAIDWTERQSDAASAFPACIATVIAPGRTYSQDGADGLQQRRVRLECMALSYGAAKVLARALTDELEASDTVDGVRFHKARLAYERDMQPEDLGGGMKVFRTILDFILPTTA